MIFFAGIGLGFMFVEISQMQRLIVFLGHPTYSLSVVLFSLLVSSGVGSYLTSRVEVRGATGSAARLLLILLAVLSVFGTVSPGILRAFQESTTLARVLLVTAMLFPLGVFMGMAFPLGMRLASGRTPALTPWLWGINGATSVCASVLAIVIALSSSISAAYWTGVVCYVASLIAFAQAAAVVGVVGSAAATAEANR
jgi:predicted membrane-bound spermidine synthase